SEEQTEESDIERDYPGSATDLLLRFHGGRLIGRTGMLPEYRRRYLSVVGIAFISWPYHGDQREAYINLVCARPGYGRAMMTTITQTLTAFPFGVQFVTLSAMANVILFYRKLGFVNTHRACVEDDDIAEAAKGV